MSYYNGKKNAGFVIVNKVEGSDITVDTALSETSTNPVENRIVAKALYNINAKNISPKKVEFLQTIQIKDIPLLDYMWMKNGDLYTAKENYKRTDFIEVEPNKEYTLCVYYRNATYSGTVSNGKIFDIDKNIIADLGDGEENIINITMPENAKYIQLSVVTDNNNTKPSNYGIAISEMYCQCKADTIEVDWLKLKAENIPNGLITPEMLNDNVKFEIGENEVKARHIDSEAENQYGENLLDGATYIDGEYIVSDSDSKTSAHASLSYTEIPVIGGKRYAITVYDKNLSQNICRFNKANGSLVRGIQTIPYYTFEPTDIADNVFIVKAPETAVKLYLNVKIAEQSTAIVKEVSAVQKSLNWLELKPENLTDETVANIIEKVEEAENTTKYKYGDSLNKPFDFSNKTLASFGDSITAGVTSPNLAVTENSYIRLFVAKQNMSLHYKRANSGSCITDSDSPYSIYKTITQFTKEVDFIIISGGTNDYNTGKPLGSYDSTDINTFYGALRGICEYLKTNFANATVIFITPIPVTKNFPNAILPLNSYRNAIYEIATLYGFNVVNGGDLGLPDTAGGWANDMIADTDGCHPTEEGHALYFRNLCGKLC